MNRAFCHLLFFVICFGSPWVSAQTYLYNQTNIQTTSFPNAVTVGDLNGDGIMDVVVANQTTISVFLGESDGTFAPKVDYAVGSSPFAIAIADFNGDHIPDLAVVNHDDSNISILLGNGDGTFGIQQTYAVGWEPLALVVADFNGDNKLDIAAINTLDGTVSILLGNGDGTFAGQSVIQVAPLPGSIAVGDFNDDGKPDLIVQCQQQASFVLLLNTGNGTFSSTNLNPPDLEPNGLAVGDFNNDGNLDFLAFDTHEGQVGVFLGDGTGNFRASILQISITPNVGANPSAIVVGDFNGDGNLDYVVESGDVLIFLGQGDGTFKQAPYIPEQGTTLVAADFNNDNYLDLGILNSFGLTILPGNGRGNFGGSTTFSIPSGGLADIAAADFNGDGKMDFAVGEVNTPGQAFSDMVVFPGQGDGTFAQPISSPQSTMGTQQMVAADLNGDGKADLVTSIQPLPNGGIVSTLNNGDGTFGVPVPFGQAYMDIIPGDFNNDGKQDLLVFGNDQSLDVLLSNGDGTFQTKVVFAPVVGFFNGFAVADFNHDGNLDIAVAAGSITNGVTVFLGNGDGTFSGPFIYTFPAMGTVALAIAAADLNGDGNIDLLVGTGSSTTGSYFFAGKGDGTFQSPVAIGTLLPANGTLTTQGNIFAADFNGDGKMDLIAFDDNAGGVSNANILLSNGDGTLGNELAFFVPFSPIAAGTAIADFNGDGVTDLVQVSGIITTSFGGGLGTPSSSNVGEFATTWISAPTIAFSTSNLNFVAPNTGTQAAPEFILLTNVGNSRLTISNIKISGEFSQTNNCPSTLVIGQGCSVGVTFTPTASGLSNGTLTFTDNYNPGTQNINLSGWVGGADFLISATPNSRSGDSGITAYYRITLTSEAGFNGPVQIACTGAPSKAMCTPVQSSVMLNGSSSVLVAVTTTGETITKNLARNQNPFSGARLFTFCFSFAPFGCFLLARKRKLAARLGMGVLLLMLISCGGGGGSSTNSSGGGQTITPGTPVGTYTLTITGTSGAVAHSTTLSLTITGS